MEVTLRVAYIALQIGPFVALTFALPYTIYGYVRSNTINVLKCTFGADAEDRKEGAGTRL